jgi:Flp pilus assembly protein TadD
MLMLAGCAGSGVERATLDDATPAIPTEEREPSGFPADTALLVQQAAQTLRLRHYREATRLYGEVVAREPFDPVPRQALGYAWLRLEEWAAAAEQFDEALRLQPASRESMLGLAVARYHLGETDAAQELLQRGLDTFPPGGERDGWRLAIERQLPGIDLDE